MLVEVDVNGQSVHTDIYKTMILALEEDAIAIETT